MVAWGRILTRVANRIESGVDDLKRRVIDPADGRRRVLPYRGYGTRDEVFISGRVLTGEAVPPADPEDPWWRNLAHTYRRLETDEVSAAAVRIEMAGASVTALSDEEGYFRAWLKPGALPADRLWHPVELSLHAAGAAAFSVTGQVLTPPATARFGIISDLDDTVMRTDVTRRLRMFREVLFGNAHTRLPFAGVAAFYRALHAGPAGADGNPVFYVSSSPWNLYELITEFLELHRIPPGPLMLRDWGITEDAVLPPDHRAHKLAHIRQILSVYPDMPFLLIGDSGQRDPEIYHDVVADHPDRILAIYIRDVTGDPLRQQRIADLADGVKRAGTTLVLAGDTRAVAEHAAAHGWIAGAALADIEVERTEQEGASADGKTSSVVIDPNGTSVDPAGSG